MAQAEMVYRGQQLLFPATDDIEVLDPRQLTDRRQAFSAGGVPESAMVLPYEEIETRIADVVRDQTVSDLEAWWSYARSGGPYSFAFDSTDKVLTALDEDALAGISSILVSSGVGIAPYRRYRIMHDLLGRNTSRNLFTSAQSLCDAPGDFGLIGAGFTVTAETPGQKVGTHYLKLYATQAGNRIYLVGPAVPLESYMVFSVWCRNYTPHLWRLRMRSADSTVQVTSPKIGPSSLNQWIRFSLSTYFPNGATSTYLVLEATVGGSLFMQTDAWQVEIKQHATPWVQGGFSETTKTASTRGFAEIVEVISVGGGTTRNRVTLKEPLKFAYSSRDAFRSLYYWERVVSLDADSPLRLKMLTSEFRHRFREVP